MNVPPARPVLVLRVGITGARSLDTADCTRLSAELHVVLLAAREKMRQLAARDRAVAAAYCHAPGVETPQPTLCFLSPLARGADRLAAREALALGYTLHVPMPFPQAEYEKDFDTPGDLAEFRALLAQAGGDQVALDGDHGPEMNRAYEAVGRYVVRHCDLLIAIWDGASSNGRGGTADIVHYAAVAGVPVLWLHATEDRAPVWIADIQDLRHPRPAAIDAAAALHSYLTSLIPPPAPTRHHRHGITGWLARLGQEGLVSPEAEHFAERERKRRWPWRAYATFIRWFAGTPPPYSPPHPPDDPVARYWFDRYLPADARAGEYAARYRSAYVWVFGLGTLALFFGALALPLPLLHPSAKWLQALWHTLAVAFALAEFAALLLILGLVMLGMRRDWHEHSIEYRLLAELYRKQQALAPLGWALPISAVRNMATADGATSERGTWIAWLFAADQRAAPLPRGDLAHAAQGQPRRAVLEELIAEQRDYHGARWKMAKTASRSLEHLGEILFLVVLICVALKVLAEGLAKVLAEGLASPGLAVLFGLAATVLPGLSAAFVGIRAYAELQLLADQSRHMSAELGRAYDRVERLDASRPLASQDLGAEAAAVATLMLQDLEGWARLFRVKTMEAG